MTGANGSYFLHSDRRIQDRHTSRMADEADCRLLLDVDNVYVSSVNHDFEDVEFVHSLPHNRVVQTHSTGHTNCHTQLIDTHDGEVIDPAWKQFQVVHRLTGGISTLLEWDARNLSFPVVHTEVLKAQD